MRWSTNFCPSTITVWPGVVAAVVAGHHLHARGEQVDDLALALVAPLGAGDHDVGHVLRVASGGRASRARARAGARVRATARPRTCSCTGRRARRRSCGVEREEPALREALVVDAAGVLPVGVRAEERAAEEDLAAGAAAVALAAALGRAERVGVLRAGRSPGRSAASCPAAASVTSVQSAIRAPSSGRREKASILTAARPGRQVRAAGARLPASRPMSAPPQPAPRDRRRVPRPRRRSRPSRAAAAPVALAAAAREAVARRAARGGRRGRARRGRLRRHHRLRQLRRRPHPRSTACASCS